MKKLVYINPIIFIDYIQKIKASMKRTTDDAELDTENCPVFCKQKLDTENCPLFGDAKLDIENELIKILEIFVQYEENEEWRRLCEYDEYLKRREKLKKALLFMYAENGDLDLDLIEWINHLNRDKRLENQVKPEEALRFMYAENGDLIDYLET